MDGIELEDGPARYLSLDRIDRDSDAANHWYRLTLNEGRNRPKCAACSSILVDSEPSDPHQLWLRSDAIVPSAASSQL